MEGSRPEATVEISLYDLLMSEFPGDNDVQAAELELSNFRWNPTADKSMTFPMFKNHVTGLLARAKIESPDAKARAIRSALPVSMKDHIFVSDLSKMWVTIDEVANTMIADAINKRQRGKENTAVSNSSHPHQTGKRCNCTCNYCKKKGHIEADCRKKQTDKNTSPIDSIIRCSFCDIVGHGISKCHKAKAAGAKYRLEKPASPPTDARDSQLRNRRCFKCQSPDHIIRDCPENNNATKGQAAVAATANTNYDIQSPVYVGFVNSCEAQAFSRSEGVQLETIALDDGVEVVAPLFHLLDQEYVKNEVFSVKGQPVRSPNGPMWSIKKTVGNQDLLTIWDTGCVHIIVPRSTVERTSQVWQKGSDLSLITIDSSTIAPLGICKQFAFKIQGSCFVRRAYVVEQACFQLLLGTYFLCEVGAGLFPRWAQIILTIPKEIRVNASCIGVRVPVSPKQLEMETFDLNDVVEIDFGPEASQQKNQLTKNLPALFSTFSTSHPGGGMIDRTGLVSPVGGGGRAVAKVAGYRVAGGKLGDHSNVSQMAILVAKADPCYMTSFRPGEKDLVQEADNPELQYVAVLKENRSPLLTTSFVLSVVKVPIYMPEPDQVRLAQLII